VFVAWLESLRLKADMQKRIQTKLEQQKAELDDFFNDGSVQDYDGSAQDGDGSVQDDKEGFIDVSIVTNQFENTSNDDVRCSH
jgi:hypothetical protein